MSADAPAVLAANSFPFWLAASYSPWFAPENYGQGLLYLALVLAVMAESKGWSIGAHVGLGLAFGATFLAHTAPEVIFIATTAYLAQRSIVHARALMSSGNRAHDLSDRLKVFQPEAPPEDPVLVRWMPFATTTPQFFDGHLDLMLPCAAWKSSFDAPLRWQNLVRTSAELVGPDDCNGDNMLLPEHAATFAAFVKEAQQQALTSSS